VNATSPRRAQRAIVAQVLLGITLFGALAGFAPQFLLLEDEVTRAALTFALEMMLPLGAAGFLLLRARLRRNRYVLRALALGSAAIEPDDIARLSSVPGYTSAVLVALFTSTVAVFLLTPFRPALLDFDTAVSLALFGIITLAAAALPLHVAVRAAVAQRALSSSRIPKRWWAFSIAPKRPKKPTSDWCFGSFSPPPHRLPS
jgi:hypothetical protein